MNELTARMWHLFALSHGLGEPKFDTELRIVNWPENLEMELKHLVEVLQGSTNSSELRACADLLTKHELSGVPEGLLQVLSRAVFDNPHTPLREN